MVALYILVAPVVVRRVQPLSTANLSPWLATSMNSISLEMSVEPEGMKRVKRMSSLVAKLEGWGSGNPGVGHKVCCQSSLLWSPGIKV